MNKQIFSLEFTEYQINLDNSILSSLGKFNLFVLEGIDNGLNLEDIADIIHIKKDFLKKKLLFMQKENFIDKNFNITERGERILFLKRFIEEFNKKNFTVVLDNYLNLKFYTKENLSKKKYNVIDVKLYDYKLQKFIKNFIIEKNSDFRKILEYLDNNNIIDKFYEDFIINTKYVTKFYYNFENLIDYYSKKGVEVRLPAVEVKFDIDFNILDDIEIVKIKEIFKTRCYDLISGEKIDNFEDINSSIKPIYSLKDVKEDKNIDFKTLLLIDIKRDIKNGSFLQKIDIESILEKV